MIVHNKKIYIVGKNSKLFKDFYQYLKSKNSEHSFEAISYKDLNNLNLDKTIYSNCILFSLSSKQNENTKLIKKIIKIFNETRIIGSTSILSKRANKFKYSKIKLAQYNEAKALFNLDHKIYCYLFGDFYKSKKNGTRLTSKFDDLEKYIFQDKLTNFSEQYAAIDGKNNKFISYIYIISEKLFGAILTAGFFKFFTNFTYGYSRID